MLVPESAHGTNPATAALLGYRVEIRAGARRRHGRSGGGEEASARPDVAAIMLTNPNTCGLFERDVVAIAEAVHAAGAYFYADGANFNAIVGKVRPGDLGVDAMHINLHKTFSTPHGGGGPGAGPVALSAALAPFAPLPLRRRATRTAFGWSSTPTTATRKPFGRMCAFHGQMGMFVRAMAYMLAHGSDGMRQASEDAVLNANYVRAGLKDLMSLPFGDRPCMHEVLFDDHWLEGTGVTTLDFAKAMIDEGYHPMTMYFPLVVHGAMLIEPTESESKASLDLFIAALRDLALAAKRGDTARFSGAPYYAPRRRLDETRGGAQARAEMDAAGADPRSGRMRDEMTELPDIASLPFEAAMKELEDIVDRLEKGNVPLEELIVIYERGEALKKHCDDLLKRAEARIEKITFGADGKPKGTEPLDLE